MKKGFKKQTYLAGMGFALVEVILATAILSGGLLMVVRVFPLGLKIEQKVERCSTASLLGQTLMEEIKRRGYDDLSEALPEDTNGQGIGEGSSKNTRDMATRWNGGILKLPIFGS